MDRNLRPWDVANVAELRAVEPTLTPVHLLPRWVGHAIPDSGAVGRARGWLYGCPARASTGTVTFLFTDIEDSTRLWEDHTALMEAALERHDDILRSAIVASGGYVFSTAGDAISGHSLKSLMRSMRRWKLSGRSPVSRGLFRRDPCADGITQRGSPGARR